MLSGVFENPGALVSVPQGLRVDGKTGLLSLSFDARLKGLLEMSLVLSDDGEDSAVLLDGKGSVRASETGTVIISVRSVNQAPNFILSCLAKQALFSRCRTPRTRVRDRHLGWILGVSVRAEVSLRRYHCL